MKKHPFSSKITLCLLITFFALIFRAEAREELPVIQRWTGSQLTTSVTSGPLPGVVEDLQWNTMNGNPSSTWGFTNAHSTLEVVLGADWNNCLGDEFTVTVEVQLTSDAVDNNGVTTQYIDTRTLEINHSMLRGATIQAGSFMLRENVYRGMVQILSTSITQGGSPATNQLPDFIELEAKLMVERYYEFDANVPTTMNSVSAQLQDPTTSGEGEGTITFSWNTVEWADEYELEWTVVSNAEVWNPNATPAPKFEAASPSNCQYDFAQNGIRIRTPETQYTIPYIFPHTGWLVCRVRGVTYQIDPADPTAPAQRVEGPWDIVHDKGNLSAIPGIGTPPFDNHFLVNQSHLSSLNWSFTQSYAEDGKHKGVISYASGDMRGRQTVSRLNTEGKSVATETIYDHKGRPAIQVLPVPLEEDLFTYFPLLNQTTTGQVYDYEAFDLDASGSCAVVTSEMSTISGASNYYSPQNPDKEGAQAYVPDAEGYPFSQTQYTPDNTGRVRATAGPGGTNKLGGKNSRYYYGVPYQEELDAIFGVNETGDAEHYVKTMVIDPNGQASVSITNNAGETVATSLAGESPDNLTALDNIGTPYMMKPDLVKKNTPVSQDGTECLEASFTHLVDYPKDHVITYDLIGDFFNEGTGCPCWECVYDLTISVIDNDCGTTTWSHSETIGELNGACTGADADNILETIPLQAGSYTITKTLCVNRQARETALAEYLDENINGCLELEQTFIDQAILEIGQNDCDLDMCGFQCLESISPDDYTDPALFLADWNACQAECAAAKGACEATYELMLGDVTPGGQYAEDATDTYSLLNPSNDFNIDYQEDIDFGSITVDVTRNGEIVTTTPDDLDYDEFIYYWEDAWAEKMVIHHPEYCYYEYCIDNESPQRFYKALQEMDTYDEVTTLNLVDANGYPNFDPNTSAMIAAGFGIPAGATDFWNDIAAPKRNAQLTPWTWNRYVHVRGFNYLTFEEVLKALSSGCDYLGVGANAFDNCISTTTLFNHPSDCNKNNDDWLHFRTMYLSALAEAMEYDRLENTEDCAGKLLEDLFDANKRIYNQTIGGMLDLDMDKDPEDILTDIQGQAGSTTSDACTSTCEGMADGWIEQLSGCGALTPALEAPLKAALIEVCVAGCDSEHPFGASTLPPGVTSSPNNYTSFAHAIASVLGLSEASVSDPLDGNFEPLCSALQIERPGPYGHSYSQANDNFPILDECACQKILDNEIDFAAAQANNTLPNGVTTEEELFYHTYDINLLNYKSTKCKCNEAFVAAHGAGVSYSKGADFKKKGVDYLHALAMPINAEIACGGCMSCFTLVRYFNDYQTLRDEPDGDLLLATYINQQEGFNLTAADYLLQMETCEALIASCGRDAVTTELGEWLGELTTAGELSSPNYTFAFTGTEFEDIYDDPGRPYRCRDISYTSSVLYAREFEQSINTFAADGSGGLIAAGHATNGDALILKQDASGKIVWNTTLDIDLQLDQIRVAVASSGDIWLFGLTTDTQPELLVANFTSTGAKQWAQRISHPKEIHQLTGIVEQPTANAFVASFSYKHPSPEEWKLGTTLVQVIDNGTFMGTNFSHNFDDLGGNVYSEELTSPYFNQLAKDANDQFVFLCMNEAAGHLILTPFSATGNPISADVEKFPEIELYCSDNGYSISQMLDGRYAILLRSKEEGAERWMTSVLAYDPDDKEIDWQHLFKLQNATETVTFQLESMAMETYIDGSILVSGLLSGAFSDIVANKSPAVFSIDATGDAQWAQMREVSGSSHMMAKAIGFDEVVMLADQALLFNRLEDHTKEACNQRTFVVTHTDEQLTEDHTTTAAASTPFISFPSTTANSNSTTVNFTPLCGERLFINYADDCKQTDCDMELKLPPHYPNFAFANLSNIQNGFPWGSTGFYAYGTIGTTQLIVSGHWDCMPACPDAPLCNRPAFIEIPIEEEDCQALLEANATYKAQLAYSNYKKDEAQKFIEAYNKKCLGSGIAEIFDMEFEHWQYQYTLYYYDQAGSLVATVPPKGVVVDFANNNPDHKMRTFYNYNSLGQLIEQNTPDGGYTQFWYDELGRIVVSQNAQQEADDRFSFTEYDEQGRPKLAGELTQTAPPIHNNHYVTFQNLETWHTAAGNTKEFVTETYYNESPSGIAALFPNGQGHLRGRVASIVYTDEVEDWRDYSSHFSYDIHGNVDHLIQEIPALEGIGHQYKHIEYEYDLISGNVAQVTYQKDEADQLIHRYTYDADNRLITTETSRDGINWSQEAKYAYYQHGPLARTELGPELWQVAGMDYAYTIQGWIKGVNSQFLDPSNDMGRDGYEPTSGSDPNAYSAASNGIHQHIARDAFGFSLEYFDGDYQGIGLTGGSSKNSFLGSNVHAPNHEELFNGNINQMVTAITDDQGTAQIQSTRYYYDQLQRIKNMQVFRDPANPSGSNAAWNWQATDDYATEYSYDANGNIETLKRNGTPSQGDPTLMDDLAYDYGTLNNQLNFVDDGVDEADYTDDFDAQVTGNYSYDKIGNLTADAAEDIASIEWGVDGKIRHITRAGNDPSLPKNLAFAYNPAGNRFVKVVKDQGSDQTEWEYTYYVHDATGNVMAVYKLDYESIGDFTEPGSFAGTVTTQDFFERISLIEQPLYGSARLGQIQVDELLSARAFKAIVNQGEITSFDLPLAYTPPAASTTDGNPLFLGQKRYEQTNHLGNVLAVISDRKFLVCDNGTAFFEADIVMSSDYYPFGVRMDKRGFDAAHRYGFQGQEQDEEFFGGAVSYKYRIHDPRIGRFLSIDPLAPEYPWNSPYAFSENMVIHMVELEGLEAAHPMEGAWSGSRDYSISGTLQGAWDGVVNMYNYFTSDNVSNSEKGEAAIRILLPIDGVSLTMNLAYSQLLPDRSWEDITKEQWTKGLMDYADWGEMLLTRKPSAHKLVKLKNIPTSSTSNRLSREARRKGTVNYRSTYTSPDEFLNDANRLVDDHIIPGRPGRSANFGDDVAIIGVDFPKRAGIVDIHIHGSPDGNFHFFDGIAKRTYSPEDMADYIKTNHGDMGAVRLFSCFGGVSAQKIANLTGKPVIALDAPRPIFVNLERGLLELQGGQLKLFSPNP